MISVRREPANLSISDLTFLRQSSPRASGDRNGGNNETVDHDKSA